MDKNSLYIGQLIKNDYSVLVEVGKKTIFAQIKGRFVNLADNNTYKTTDDGLYNGEIGIDYETLEQIDQLEKNVSKAYIKRILRKRI